MMADWQIFCYFFALGVGWAKAFKGGKERLAKGPPNTKKNLTN